VTVTRRELITGVAKVGLPAAVVVSVGAEALKTETIPVPNAAVGLLYDATICIDCKACVAACAEAECASARRTTAATRAAPAFIHAPLVAFIGSPHRCAKTDTAILSQNLVELGLFGKAGKRTSEWLMPAPDI